VTPDGWAAVSDARGRRLGQTPLQLTLPAGRHTFVLRPFGTGAPRRVSVQIRAGETRPLSVDIAGR
jgi:hypothetical protein